LREPKKEKELDMKNYTLFYAIGAASLIAQTAMADYTGLDFDWQINEDGTWTARIFANFDAETDQLNAIFGDSDNELRIHADNGFFQSAYGGATSMEINPDIFTQHPSIAWDSWVTIGQSDWADNNMLDLGVDWSDFETNGGDIWTDNGLWFATPDDPQVLAGADLRVMVGQFTMFGLDSHVSGVLNLQGKSGNFETFQARDQAFDFSIPAPSALALLGIAGLASRRRRC